VAWLCGGIRGRKFITDSSAKGLITLADDWDAPIEDFEEYTR
jgi:hypothetical protein